MANPLRERRTPSELAARGQVIDFDEKLGVFERLAGIVRDDLDSLEPDKMPRDWRNSVVSGTLRFGFADAQNILPKLEGGARVTIDAVCQRCLEPFRVPLTVELRLLFGDTESAPGEGDGFEVWELEDDRLRPLDLVEEALIMALPFAATHTDSETCPGPDEPTAGTGRKIRPFAALKAQMGKEK